MRRKLPLAIIGLAAAVLLTVPGVASARTAKPTLTLVEYCPVVDGQQFYGVQVSLSGFPPNTPFDASLVFDGSEFSVSTMTDEFGNFCPNAVAISEPVEFATSRVVFVGGELVQTLKRPCHGPPTRTEKVQCQNRGYVGLGFKNQGDCVSFVAMGGTPG